MKLQIHKVIEYRFKTISLTTDGGRPFETHSLIIYSDDGEFEVMMFMKDRKEEE